jgi:hypothetical protein
MPQLPSCATSSELPLRLGMGPQSDFVVWMACQRGSAIAVCASDPIRPGAVRVHLVTGGEM